MKGKVKWYNHMKGFGFIHGDDGNDFFVHRTAIPADISLYEEDLVEFDMEKTEQGLKAVNIKKLKNT